jgi:hypothetical protein
MKTLFFNVFLTLVASAVATDPGEEENELTTTTTVAATSPHVHIRGASDDGGIKERGVQELTPVSSCGRISQINDPDIGRQCRIDRDCNTLYPRCGRLICVKSRPNDTFGKCAREPTCHEEGDYCEENYECCGSYQCEDSICTRDVLSFGECRAAGGSCRNDNQCCGTVACTNRRCSGTTDCKKLGGYCEVDSQCCEGLECGVSNHCVKVNIGCSAQGEYCENIGIFSSLQATPLDPPCCDGFKCNRGARCIRAGVSQCKLLDDYCDSFNDQCCGDLVCDRNTFTCTDANPDGPTQCLEEKTGDFCTSYRDCNCDGMRCTKNSCCRDEGQFCEKTDDCCGSMECTNRKCIKVTPPIEVCQRSGEQCLRTKDCCSPMHCRSNMCR